MVEWFCSTSKTEYRSWDKVYLSMSKHISDELAGKLQLLQRTNRTTVFRSRYRDRDVVVKISDPTYEGDILRYLEGCGCRWSPRLYVSIDVPDSTAWRALACFSREYTVEPFVDRGSIFPRRVLIYDYVDGEEGDHSPEMRDQILKQIIELASYGITHGDIWHGNTIKRLDGSYTLIDFDAAKGIGDMSVRFPESNGVYFDLMSLYGLL